MELRRLKTEQVCSTQRPLPLVMRSDLVMRESDAEFADFVTIKDPIGLKYYRLRAEQVAVLRALDGHASLTDLRDLLQRRFPTTRITFVDVQQTLIDLHEKNLILSDRPEQGEGLIRRRRREQLQKIGQAFLSPLYFRLPGWDPENTLRRLLSVFGWIFHPAVIALTLVIDFASLIFVAARFDDITQRLPEFRQFFGWPNLVFLWITLAGSKILHEFGHGLACRYYGAECHSMGIMVLVFSPTLYCDVTDAWMLPSKWKRIAIAAAGMYVEVFLAACAIFVWWNTQPGLLQHLCLNVFFVSTVSTVIFNANPLMRYDGYYMLSDWLEIPNLRQKASKMFQELFARHCLGVVPEIDPFMPVAHRRCFAMYAVGTVLYQFVVLFGITVFLYSVLKPYRLQSLGVAMAVISLVSTVGGLLYTAYQQVIMPRRDPISHWRLAVTSLAFLGLGALAVTVPLPWYAEAPFTVEPIEGEQLLTSMSGRLVRIAKRPGDRVEAGELIAELINDELEARIRKLSSDRNAQEKEIETYRRLDRPRELQVAEQHLELLNGQMKEAAAMRAQTRIVSSVAGTIVAAPRTSPTSAEQLHGRLPGWTGDPLDEVNIGCFLDERTTICSISPREQFRAVLLIDQADRRELAAGQHVRMKIEQSPQQTLQGSVESISDRSLDEAPKNLSNKYGGPLATVQAPEGRETLTSAAFQASVPLESAAMPLRTGMRGSARVIVDHRSAWDWTWRWLRTTFRFRV